MLLFGHIRPTVQFGPFNIAQVFKTDNFFFLAITRKNQHERKGYKDEKEHIWYLFC